MFRRVPRLKLEVLDPRPPGAWLVGGAARDLLRGAVPKDLDWLTPDPEGVARDLAARVGGSAFPLDAARGHWRVVAAGGVQHDFVPLHGSLEADLARRDFTVNALAVGPDGLVTDPLGGLRDLRARQLRMLSEANLREDPLRLLRAARLSVTLGFRIERDTEAAVRRLAHAGLPLPAWERVRDELNALMLHANAARGVLRLEHLGLLALYLPELREGIGVHQGGFHHLDVFHHGVEALHQLLARFPDADLTLRWATLLHDLGKPRTAMPDEDGRGYTRFYGHDKVGAEMARGLLRRLREPEALVERAAALISAHMVPLPAGEREARRFAHRRRALLPDLLRLMLADREAGRGPQSSAAGRLAYQQAISRVLEALEEQPRAPEPLLRGEDVMALLGVPPGPLVGEALHGVAEARALGDLGTPDEARAWVRDWWARRTLDSHE